MKLKTTRKEIKNKDFYDLKNLLFKAVVTHDEQLENAIKKEIQKRAKI